MSEATDQAALFDFLARMEGRYPALKWAFHVPNGEKRDKATAAKLKEMGTKPGVPDVIFPWAYYDERANIAYPGCVIELKHGRNSTTPDQDAWLEHFRRCGWFVAVFHDWMHAARLLLRWVGGDEREVEGL